MKSKENKLQDGCALQFVREQTPESCLAAVNRNGYVVTRKLFGCRQSKWTYNQ